MKTKQKRKKISITKLKSISHLRILILIKLDLLLNPYLGSILKQQYLLDVIRWHRRHQLKYNLFINLSSKKGTFFTHQYNQQRRWQSIVRLSYIHFLVWEQHACITTQRFVRSMQTSSLCMEFVSSKVVLSLCKNPTILLDAEFAGQQLVSTENNLVEFEYELYMLPLGTMLCQRKIQLTLMRLNKVMFSRYMTALHQEYHWEIDSIKNQVRNSLK